MLRLLSILFLIYFSFPFSFSQDQMGLLNKSEKEYGKSYMMTNYGNIENEVKYEAGVMVLPANDSIIYKDTLQFKNGLRDTMLHIDARGKWIVGSKRTYYCVNSDTVNMSYIFAYIEIPPQKVFVNKSRLLDKKNNTYEVQTKIRYYPDPYWLKMEDWKQGKLLNVSYIDKMPIYRDDKGNQYIVFHEGVYSELREAICCGGPSSCCGGPPRLNSTQQLINAINKKGYQVPRSDVFSEELKTALIDFQKKNGFPVGNLNMETLRALGLQY